jgi:hypothetical protein
LPSSTHRVPPPRGVGAERSSSPVGRRFLVPSTWPLGQILSWGFQRWPLHRHRSSASTPALPHWRGRPLRLVHASARLCQRTGPVPPSRFLTALMVSSTELLAGLLRPAADPGVRRVSGPSWSLSRAPSSRPSPTARAPFEALSSTAAVSLSLVFPPGRSCPPAVRLRSTGRDLPFLGPLLCLPFLSGRLAQKTARQMELRLQGLGPLVESAPRVLPFPAGRARCFLGFLLL